MKAYELALMARHFVEARWRWQALHSAALTRYQAARATDTECVGTSGNESHQIVEAPGSSW
jgi:hypothetical protein